MNNIALNEREPSGGPSVRHEFEPVLENETKAQLAKRINCSTRTVDKLMTRGLPYLKLSGKLVRFPRRQVDEWLASQVIKR